MSSNPANLLQFIVDLRFEMGLSRLCWRLLWEPAACLVSHGPTRHLQAPLYTLYKAFLDKQVLPRPYKAHRYAACAPDAAGGVPKMRTPLMIDRN